jgi:putative hydrolase of the HAD superfamily
LLDEIISSADVRLHKPDPRIFELACRNLGVDPHEAAHIGDHHYADILGASAVGMKAVLIDRHGVMDPDLGAIADLDTIESVLGLDSEIQGGRAVSS